MIRLPFFYLTGGVIGLAPWVLGGIAYGKIGLLTGLVVSFLGILLLQDANRRHMEQEKNRLRRTGR